MSYGLPSQRADGAYHKIKLEVVRPGLEVSYRKGYYTQKEQLSYENSKKEDILDALSGPGNMNEIPMTLAYNYSIEDDSTYAVSFVTNVNVRGLQFPEEDSRRRNIVSLVLVAFDEGDHYISGLEKSIDFRLLDSSYASLRDYGLTSRVQFKLPMGRYRVKAIVRMFWLYNLPAKPDEWNLVAKPKLVNEKGAELAIAPILLKKSIASTATGEAVVGLSLPFQGVGPGKYRLVIEVADGNSANTSTVFTDLEFTK